MNGKNLIAAACAAVSTTAFAQSSVTLSGVADAAVRYVTSSGRGHVVSLANGGNSTSRIQLRGVEDLGGGLSASFTLESGINLDNGSIAGNFFDRESHVSLNSSTWGSVRLGRDYTSVYRNWGARYDPFNQVGVGLMGNLYNANTNGPIRAAFGTDPNTLVRASNSVQYFIPPIVRGLEATVMYSFDERQPATAGAHKWVGGRVNYNFGSFAVGAATSQVKNSRTAGEHLTDSSVGAVYNAGGMRLSAVVRQASFLASKQRLTTLGFLYITGPHEFKASYGRMDVSGTVGAASVDANDASQVALGYVYKLSKRTALYATAAQIRNKGQAAQVISGGPGVTPGTAITGTEFGLRHAF